MPEDNIIGKNVRRVKAREKVTGQARFVHDMELQGMLEAELLISPHAHARIENIDTSRAEELDGVWTVMTGKDVSQYRIGLYLVDKPILAVNKVRYQGEPVAAVAAENKKIAKKAVELIEVEYEKLPAALEIDEALADDAPLVHENLGEYDHLEGVFFPRPGTNIANHFKLRKGDIEKALEEADYVIENEFSLPQVNHVALETHTSIASWKTGGKVKIWTSAQSPYAVRDLLSNSMDIPHQDIEVNVPYVGGGFGGKAGIHFEPLVTCLSRRCEGRPVKFVASRKQEFNSVPVRQGLVSSIRTGVNEDGEIVAQDIDFYWDSGANADYGVNVTRAAGYAGAGPYEIDNVKMDSYTVYTNKLYGTAYRGFGHLEAHWAIERQLDMVAEVLGMDPYELRDKNVLRPGSHTITGEEINEYTGRADECLEAVAEELKWEEKLEEPTEEHKVRGRGLALLHKAPAMPTNTSTGAIIKFNENGSVDVTVSLTDYGQGTYTALAQIVSDQLNLPLEKINMVWENNTETQPYDWQTVASKGLFMTGNAIINACQDLIEQMKEIAAQPLRASVEELAVGEEKIYLEHEPDEHIKYEELAIGYTYPNGNAIGGPLIGRGSYIARGLTNLDPETGQGLPALDWTYGAHGAIVEVDTETGEIDVIKIASAFDLGKIINEGNVLGQVEGGVIQGLGSAVMEGYQFDEEGELLTRSFTDYKIPTIKDLPELEPILIENEQIDGPYGARGVAEHPMISVPSVVGNAIQDALGLEIKELPLIPEKITEYLKK